MPNMHINSTRDADILSCVCSLRDQSENYYLPSQEFMHVAGCMLISDYIMKYQPYASV